MIHARTDGVTPTSGGVRADPAVPVQRVAAPVRVTVVVPTYKERENIPLLVERLAAVRQKTGLALELVFMDDNSKDGSAEYVRDAALPWVGLVTRTTNRGLSPAVLDGIAMAAGDTVVVMDADLSHPPEKIPEMLAALDDGADFVIGSRYVSGGTCDEKWGLFRWLNSRVATLLARPLTTAKDPMAGFFAFPRRILRQAAPLNPVGYKIGLEILVKTGCRRVAEVPIHFADRVHGESKLSFKEQIRYLKHVRRLMVYKYGLISHAAQFAVVGFVGTLVNLAVVSAALLAMPAKAAIAVGIVLSLVSNFALNRRFTFNAAGSGSVVHQFLGFVAACSVGGIVNYWTALRMLDLQWSFMSPQLAAVAGIVAGMSFNFILSRQVVFRRWKATAPRAAA